MTMSTSTAAVLKTCVVLLVGAALFAGLYWAGLREVAWIGFVVAGLMWNAVPSGRPGDFGDTIEGKRGNHQGGDDVMHPIAFTDLKRRTYVATPGTRVTIRVPKLRLFTVRAGLDQVSAAVEVDPATGHLDVRGSVPVGTFRSGNARRDIHVLGPAFLDASSHPSIRFHSTGVELAAGGRAVITGDLTLHGHTLPVTWDVANLTANRSGTAVRAVAETSISRSAWGMTAWRWLAGDVVQVRVDILAACDE